jgi:YidC/Oxa1 family membrane protein insertase
MIPKGALSSGAYFSGEKRKVTSPDGSYDARRISVGLIMPTASARSVTHTFEIYAGPLDYSRLKKHNADLEDFIDWGWTIIKPFSYAVYWATYMLHKVIPNYGVVVILIAVLLKVLTYPLTKKQLKSMKAMQELQPRMKEIQAKYKDDPQKMNKEVMALYKREKVNPLAGCLLILPQMPFLFALYQVFRSTFEFRQAYFIPMYPDLSQPDGFPYIMLIIMAVSMFLQQKLSITDPKQKMIAYIMPAVLLWVFRSFPVGLVLYWSAYSVLSIIETLTIKRPQRPANPEVK